MRKHHATNDDHCAKKPKSNQRTNWFLTSLECVSTWEQLVGNRWFLDQLNRCSINDITHQTFLSRLNFQPDMNPAQLTLPELDTAHMFVHVLRGEEGAAVLGYVNTAAVRKYDLRSLGGQVSSYVLRLENKLDTLFATALQADHDQVLDESADGLSPEELQLRHYLRASALFWDACWASPCVSLLSKLAYALVGNNHHVFLSRFLTKSTPEIWKRCNHFNVYYDVYAYDWERCMDGDGLEHVGTTLLQEACEHDSWKCARLLVHFRLNKNKNGAGPGGPYYFDVFDVGDRHVTNPDHHIHGMTYSVSSYGMSPVHVACWYGHVRTLNELLSAPPYGGHSNSSPINRRTNSNYFNQVQKMSSPVAMAITPLHALLLGPAAATAKGRVVCDAVEELIRRGADVNALSGPICTSHLPPNVGCPPHSAPVLERSDDRPAGISPLSLAVLHGNPLLVRTLLAHGATPNVVSGVEDCDCEGGLEQERKVMEFKDISLAKRRRYWSLATHAAYLWAMASTTEVFSIGDRILIRGLSSNVGQPLNGKIAHVRSHINSGTNSLRYSCEFADGSVRSVKPSNCVVAPENRAKEDRHAIAQMLADATARMPAPATLFQSGRNNEHYEKWSRRVDRDCPGLLDSIKQEQDTIMTDTVDLFNVGDRVRLHSFTSKSILGCLGRNTQNQLNGMTATIRARMHDSSLLYECELTDGSVKKIKPMNLKFADGRAAPDEDADSELSEIVTDAFDVFGVGDRVLIQGLSSSAGKVLNGKIAVVRSRISNSTNSLRYGCEFANDDSIRSIKPSNCVPPTQLNLPEWIAACDVSTHPAAELATLAASVSSNVTDIVFDDAALKGFLRLVCNRFREVALAAVGQDATVATVQASLQKIFVVKPSHSTMKILECMCLRKMDPVQFANFGQDIAQGASRLATSGGVQIDVAALLQCCCGVTGAIARAAAATDASTYFAGAFQTLVIEEVIPDVRSAGEGFSLPEHLALSPQCRITNKKIFDISIFTTLGLNDSQFRYLFMPTLAEMLDASKFHFPLDQQMAALGLHMPMQAIAPIGPDHPYSHLMKDITSHCWRMRNQNQEVAEMHRAILLSECLPDFVHANGGARAFDHLTLGLSFPGHECKAMVDIFEKQVKSLRDDAAAAFLLASKVGGSASLRFIVARQNKLVVLHGLLSSSRLLPTEGLKRRVQELGELLAAIDIDVAPSKDPEDQTPTHDVLLLLAHLCQERRQFDLAKALYEHVLGTCTEVERKKSAHCGMAEIFCAQGSLNDAVEMFRFCVDV